MHEYTSFLFLDAARDIERLVDIVFENQFGAVSLAGPHPRLIRRTDHNDFRRGAQGLCCKCRCDRMISGADRSYSSLQLIGIQPGNGGKSATRLEGTRMLQKFEFGVHPRAVAQLRFDCRAANDRRLQDSATKTLCQGANLFKIRSRSGHYLCKLP